MAKKTFNKGNNSNNFKGGLVKSQLNNYANLNFSYYPGSPLLRDAGANEDERQTIVQMETVPTLVAATFVPTIGAFGSEANSPINQAVAQTFAKLRSDNSGKVNYASTDLMIFIMSHRSLYSFHAWGVRILGLLNFFSAKDFNIPQEFYEALKVDVDDFRRNRMNLAGYLDSFAMNVNTLAVPNVFPIIREDCYLCNSIFKLDESNDMGQYLLFEPEGFYRYEENAESGVNFGTLQWIGLPSSGNLTFDQFCALGDRLIKDVKTSEDHYIMCGDIRKSFGTNLLTLDSTDPKFELQPVFNKDVLDSLHNANICGVTMGPVTQEGIHETITQEFGPVTVADPVGYNILLDSVDWNPDPIKVVELCKWKTVVRNDAIYTSGPQILTGMKIFVRNLTNDNFDSYSFMQYITTNPSSGSGMFSTLAANASLRTMIGNILPFQYITIVGTDDKVRPWIWGKPRCATIVVDTQLLNINRVKFYELFGVGTF